LLLVLAFMVSAVPPRAMAASSNCSASYTVVAGDTLYGIATSYNVAMESLATANNLTAPYVLTIGQVLCIPSGATVPSASGTTTPTTTSTDPTLVVTRTEDGLVIDLVNFANKSIYYVRAGVIGLKTHQWTRLGLIRVPKSGAASKLFPLPKKLADATNLHVCLKNARTNGLICVLNRPQNPTFTP
jgi:hypothetical protein